MPFKEPFETYYRAIIAPAVEDAALRPVRADSIFRPSPIIGDVWQMIQDARVLVAELTEKNANVFYELGLAHAIGKPVVLISETLGDVPFDLQALRVILYDKNDPEWGARLRDSLSAYLRDTTRDVTTAIPAMFQKVVKSQAPNEPEISVRLAALEQQMASLRHAAPSDPYAVPGSYSEFLDRFKRVRSRGEAVGLAHIALNDWHITEFEVREGLRGRFPARVAEEIIKTAKRQARGGAG